MISGNFALAQLAAQGSVFRWSNAATGISPAVIRNTQSPPNQHPHSKQSGSNYPNANQNLN